MRLLDQFLFYKVAPRQVRYLRSPDYANADGLARNVLNQMEEDFLVGPPLTIHLPNPELLAAVWSMARECQAADRDGRPLREVVAAVVSRLNQCPYCLDIHSAMLHSFEHPGAAESLRRGVRFDDPGMEAAASWAAATLTPGAAILSSPPFGPKEAPRIVGTAICFHYLNRMVNVFLEPFPVPGAAWMKSAMARVSGKILRPRLANQKVIPGAFLLPRSTAPLPPEFAWVESNPNIAAAFRSFVAEAEDAGKESVDPEVREGVLARIDTWRGEAPPLGRAWVNEAVSALDKNHRPAARLALLTALASYQVDEALIGEFRSHQPPGRARDRDLINLTSWASFASVRRIASWLTV